MIKLLSNWPRRMAGFLLKYIDEKGVMFGLSWSPSRKWKPVAWMCKVQRVWSDIGLRSVTVLFNSWLISCTWYRMVHTSEMRIVSWWLHTKTRVWHDSKVSLILDTGQSLWNGSIKLVWYFDIGHSLCTVNTDVLFLETGYWTFPHRFVQCLPWTNRYWILGFHVGLYSECPCADIYCTKLLKKSHIDIRWTNVNVKYPISN